MPDKLFVYGTLKPGQSMDHLLHSIGGTWEKGSVRGKFIGADEIPGFPYPGVILDDTAGTVDGYLFTSEYLSNHWNDLDRYEGSSYERVITQVTLRNGSVTDAYIYELKVR
ncbi:MAG TPA: gamma-glutamylcyclotransferase family protein [Balneolaceae bacterium]|nr:gamma-glutamylcyclotransferase family protein [Balneolaceae bacterium]